MTPARAFACRFAAALIVAVAVATASPAAARTPERSLAAVSRLWDEGHVLTSSAREDLERRLGAAEKRSGVPLYLLVTERIHGQSAAEFAAQSFAAHALAADPARNAVLLVVALAAKAAAVETGKGNAGIVPEVDALRIAKQLSGRLSSQHPETAIGQAIVALAASAQATAARRTPLPRDPLDEPVDDAPASAVAPADAGALWSDASLPEDVLAVQRALPNEGADGGVLTGMPVSTPPKPGRRSRLPIAIGIAALVVVGLGLRRRKQNASSSRPSDEDRPRRF